METFERDILIIGGGVAGITAAIYAVRAGMRVTVFERQYIGGQIVNTSEIENYPALPHVSGFDFAQNLSRQVKDLQIPVSYSAIQEIDIDSPVKRIVTKKGEYTGRAVILATGAKHRPVGCKGEDKFAGRGISYCATCDGAFYKGGVACVVGGGNTALMDALYLSDICTEVYLIHRREEFRADQVLVDAIRAKANVRLKLGFVVDEIRGDKQVESVLLQSKKDPEQYDEIKTDGVFVAVGMQPDNSGFSSNLALDETGYIIAGEDCKTNLDMVFAAGDARTKAVRQLVTAAADGAVSATLAAEMLRRK